MFFAAQFVSFFSWSQLGLITAIKGAEVLQQLHLPLPLLLTCFIVFSAFINLFIGSSSAKWTLLAPVFVPMFMLVGITPEATQMAYRIGDSTTNIITPLMPYFGVVLAFMLQYNKQIGAGTLIALMLPYSIALFLSWAGLFALWLSFNFPLGPNSFSFLP
jgi:aminobenzoyl-glutamate transport protein